MQSPEGSAADEPAVCSQRHQSLLVLPPSTWCAEVALPYKKSGGKSATGEV